MNIETIRNILTKDINALADEIVKIFSEHEEAAYRRTLNELSTNWVRNRTVPVIDQRPTPTLNTPVMNSTNTLAHEMIMQRLDPHLKTCTSVFSSEDEIVTAYRKIFTQTMVSRDLNSHLIIGLEGMIDRPCLRLSIWSENKKQFLAVHLYIDNKDQRGTYPSIHWAPSLVDQFRVRLFLTYHDEGVQNFLEDPELHDSYFIADVRTLIDPFYKPKSKSLI